MHEAAIAQSIIDIATKHLIERGYRRVTRVAVTVGRLSSVVPESLDFAFKAIARDTEVENAELEINETDARGRCRDCGAEFAAEGFFAVCESCGSADVQVSGGDDLTIDSIDVER